MKPVYLLLYFLFPTKIPNSVNESCWKIKIKNAFLSLLPLGFSGGMFRNSLPSVVLTQSQGVSGFGKFNYCIWYNWTLNSEGVYCYIS